MLGENSLFLRLIEHTTVGWLTQSEAQKTLFFSAILKCEIVSFRHAMGLLS